MGSGLGFSSEFQDVLTRNKGSKETNTVQSWEVGVGRAEGEVGTPSDSDQ